jgi:hypothetical protein
MSRKKVSIWTADTDDRFYRANKKLICLGHYATVGYGEPTAAFTIELVDSSRYAFSESEHMSAVIDKVLPHPVKYHQTWSQLRGRRSVYLWKPVPPTGAFVAMGYVATTTSQEPSVELVRCVPRTWVLNSKRPPQPVWDDAGTAGSAGSFWTLNLLNLLGAVPGHDPPAASECFEFRKHSFQLNEFEVPSLTAQDERKALPSFEEYMAKADPEKWGLAGKTAEQKLNAKSAEVVEGEQAGQAGGAQTSRATKATTSSSASLAKQESKAVAQPRPSAQKQPVSASTEKQHVAQAVPKTVSQTVPKTVSQTVPKTVTRAALKTGTQAALKTGTKATHKTGTQVTKAAPKTAPRTTSTSAAASFTDPLGAVSQLEAQPKSTSARPARRKNKYKM